MIYNLSKTPPISKGLSRQKSRRSKSRNMTVSAVINSPIYIAIMAVLLCVAAFIGMKRDREERLDREEKWHQELDEIFER